jgi:4-hydroxybenzoyl-CoA thioesterase
MIPVDWKSLFEPALTNRAPGSGHSTALRNSRKVRIEWSHCDPAGIVFYPRYFEIFDASTAALFERALGLTFLQSLKTFNFAGYPLARTRARFVRPTRYGDDVTVETTVKFGHASFDIDHRISLNNLTCVECAETRVWVVQEPAAPGRYKSQPIPEAVRMKFGLVPSS